MEKGPDMRYGMPTSVVFQLLVAQRKKILPHVRILVNSTSKILASNCMYAALSRARPFPMASVR